MQANSAVLSGVSSPTPTRSSRPGQRRDRAGASVRPFRSSGSGVSAAARRGDGRAGEPAADPAGHSVVPPRPRQPGRRQPRRDGRGNGAGRLCL